MLGLFLVEAVFFAVVEAEYPAAAVVGGVAVVFFVAATVVFDLAFAGEGAFAVFEGLQVVGAGVVVALA